MFEDDLIPGSELTLYELPTGGFQAWLQVAGAFRLYFNS